MNNPSSPALPSSAPLDGKVCLVTGGTRGIGRAIVEMLITEGASVTLSGLRQESVDRALEELAIAHPAAFAAGKVTGKAADVKKHDEVGELFRFVDSRYGGLDVLVNNAGIGVFRSIRDVSLEEWQSVIDTNLSGVFFCSREALFRFVTRGSGYIVNISSLAGSNAFAGGSAYNASKFGLNGLSEAMMQDVRSDNVRVSTVAPGSVATGFSGRVDNSGSEWKVWPKDVAEIVRMLLLMPARTLVSRVEVRPSKPGKPGR